jgi:hypothetical protein
LKLDALLRVIRGEIAGAEISAAIMNGTAMSDRLRFSFGAVCCVSSVLCLAAVSPSFARDTCAARGPDFALVEGTHSCLRIGGHMRVQFSNSAENDHFTSGGMSASATSATLRSDSLDGRSFGEPDHMRVDTNDESYR